MNSERTGWFGRFIEVLIPVCVLLLPSLGLWWLINAAESIDLETRTGDSRAELAEITAHLARLSQPDTFLQELTERISRSIRWGGNPASHLRFFAPETFALYLFDEKGKRILREGFALGKVNASERFLESVRKAARDRNYLATRLEKTLAENFAGNDESFLTFGINPGSLIDMSGTGLPRFGGWFPIRFPARRKGHLLVFIDSRKVSPVALVSEAMKRIQALAGKEFCFGWLNLSDPAQNGVSKGQRLPAWLAGSLKRSIPETSFTRGGKLFSVADTSSGIRLVGIRKTPDPTEGFQVARGVFLILAVLFVLVWIWAMAFGVSQGFSIRTQVVGIFGVAGVAGLSALIVFSQLYKKARQESLVRQEFHDSLGILEKIDGNFMPSFGYLVKKYREVIRQIHESPDRKMELLLPLEETRKTGFIEIAVLVDKSGEPIFQTPKKSEQVKRGTRYASYGNLLSNLGRQFLEKYNSTTVAIATGEGVVSSREMMGVLLDRPVDRLIKDRSSLQQLNLGGKDTVNFVDVVLDAAGRGLYCLFVAHETGNLEIRHLKTTGDFYRRNSSYLLVAVPRDLPNSIPIFPDPGIMKDATISSLHELLRQTRSNHQRIAPVKGVDSLIVAMPGKNLIDYSLFLVSPFAPIAAKSAEFSRGFLALSALSTLFALFLGGILGQKLISPVRALAEGIDNLGAMKLDNPVNIATGDELQMIGQALNAIMADVNEFALAKTVQESLLPSAPLKVGPIRCQGWSRAPTDIGGELFDFVKVGENKVAFMVGDIASRGVSAALLMAMSKMAIRLFLDLSPDSPAQVLNELDNYLRVNLRKGQEVSFFLGIADPDARNLIWSGGGTCFPILFSPEGGIEKVDAEPETLGGAFHKPLRDHTLPMTPGTRLFVCTDGILCARGPDNAVFGPERTLQLFGGLGAAPGGVLGKSVFKALDSHQGSAGITEDQTFLLVEFTEGKGVRS